MSTVPDDFLLDFDNITVMRGETAVLRHFSLQIRRGEHIAILGPNGSGKSTLVKLITCDLYPHAGVKRCRFSLFGRRQWALEDVRRRIGIVALDQLQQLSHEVTVREVTVREVILSGFFNSLGLWPHHTVAAAQECRAREILHFLEITPLAHRSLATLSSGEQRRVLIGRALVHDPEALVLDEPTNSLDPGSVREFRQILRKLAQAGKSLILVTHHISDLIPEIERVILMKGGRIEADGPTRRMLTSAALSRLFGAKLRVVKRGAAYDVVSA